MLRAHALSSPCASLAGHTATCQWRSLLWLRLGAVIVADRSERRGGEHNGEWLLGGVQPSSYWPDQCSLEGDGWTHLRSGRGARRNCSEPTSRRVSAAQLVLVGTALRSGCPARDSRTGRVCEQCAACQRRCTAQPSALSHRTQQLILQAAPYLPHTLTRSNASSLLSRLQHRVHFSLGFSSLFLFPSLSTLPLCSAPSCCCWRLCA